MPELASLRRIREGVPLTQNELALLSGISRHTISDAESLTLKPRPSTVRALASALNVSPGDLIRTPETVEAQASAQPQ